MNEIRVLVEAEVNPTEDLEKVKKAVENLYPTASLEIKSGEKKGLLVAKTEGKSGLARFHALLRQERVLDAARRILLRGKWENHVTFYLNKQVAYVDHISFCEPFGESPLGPIKVEIACDDPEELIDWLAPRSIKK